MSQRSWQILLLVFLASAALIVSILPVWAPPGETYSLAITPGRTQETDTPGVTLTLTVANATSLTSYSFTWRVTDPSGASTTATNGTFTSSGQTSFSVSVVYPQSFTGAMIRYVGNYAVAVDQTTPSNRQNAATGTFVAGLTDQTSYQRTFTVSIKAQFFRSLDPVTVTIAQGANPPVHQTSQLSDSNGNFAHDWQIPYNITTGTYTVALSSSRNKNPPDIQSFSIYPADITIPQLSVSRSIFQRTETVEFTFAPTYLSGLGATSGSTTIQITEADGTTTHSVTSSYDFSQGLFRATYKSSLTAQTGVWVARIDADSFDDGFGNVGPAGIVVRGFTVEESSFTIVASIRDQVYSIGDLVPIYAIVTAPDGSVFSAGSITATLSYSGRQVGSPVNLLFDQSQGRWVGSYGVAANDPTGVWVVDVRASDTYGNYGQGSTSAVINVAPPGLSSYLFVLLAAVVAAAGIFAAFLFLRRKSLVRKVLSVDFQAIDREAKKVEDQEFFKNIRDQLKKKKSETEGDGYAG